MEKLQTDHKTTLRVHIRVEYVKFTGWRATGGGIIILGTEPWMTLGRLTHALYRRYQSFHIESVDIEYLEDEK